MDKCLSAIRLLCISVYGPSCVFSWISMQLYMWAMMQLWLYQSVALYLFETYTSVKKENMFVPTSSTCMCTNIRSRSLMILTFSRTDNRRRIYWIRTIPCIEISSRHFKLRLTITNFAISTMKVAYTKCVNEPSTLLFLLERLRLTIAPCVHAAVLNALVIEAPLARKVIRGTLWGRRCGS